MADAERELLDVVIAYLEALVRQGRVDAAINNLITRGWPRYKLGLGSTGDTLLDVLLGTGYQSAVADLVAFATSTPAPDLVGTYQQLVFLELIVCCYLGQRTSLEASERLLAAIRSLGQAGDSGRIARAGQTVAAIMRGL